MTTDQLAEKILITAISQGMSATTAGRSLGLSALAHDARMAARVLMGEVELAGMTARPKDGPPIGRPRKVRVREDGACVHGAAMSADCPLCKRMNETA